MKNIALKSLTALMISTAVVGCSKPTPLTNRNSELTHGNVQMKLKVGQTSKSDVMQIFGAPNAMTRDRNGHESWTYQRSAQVSEADRSAHFWGSGESSGFGSSSRMMTLIIKFDENDMVSDFSSRASTF